jgi:hypothetical protein
VTLQLLFDSQGGIIHDNFILERHNLKRYRDLYSLTSVSSHWQKCGSRRELFQRLCASKTIMMRRRSYAQSFDCSVY